MAAIAAALGLGGDPVENAEKAVVKAQEDLEQAKRDKIESLTKEIAGMEEKKLKKEAGHETKLSDLKSQLSKLQPSGMTQTAGRRRKHKGGRHTKRHLKKSRKTSRQGRTGRKASRL
jgi:hypothetical protein